MTSLSRRLAALAAAVAAAGLVTFTGPSASAGTVTVQYLCNSGPIIVIPVTFTVTVTAPATVSRGQTAPVRVDVLQEGTLTRAPVPAGTNTGWMELRLGGASTGTVRADGLANPALQAGERHRYEGGVAQVTFADAGVVTFTSDRLLLNGRAGCIVRSAAGTPVAASTTVS